MELIELQRWYDEKEKEICFYMEIAYSTGRLKQRHLYIKIPWADHLTWNYQVQYFNSTDDDHKDAFEANYYLMYMEDFIYQAFKEELQGDIYIDDCFDMLLDYCRRKKEIFQRFRECQYTICSALLLPRSVIR
ncbi:MAG TPA: hypothetical protein VGN63_19630 [Flavisolibacter sp.]|jgi:hypothetical protein|nr:hypothetical protein [Flavisolibacter sp.]